MSPAAVRMAGTQTYEPDADLGQLVDHPDNPREGDDDAVAESIDVNGFYGAIVAQTSTRRILAGHTRRRDLAKAGATHGPVIWVDVDDDRALRILLADNRYAELARWNPGKLADVLSAMGADIGGSGFTPADVAIAIAQAGDAAGQGGTYDPTKIGSVLVIHAPVELIEKFNSLPGDEAAQRLAALLDRDDQHPDDDAGHGPSDEWYTPRWIFDAAGLEFDLDPCAPADPAHRACPARRYLTADQDGLTAPWDGLVWMNPPFSKPAPWVERFTAHPEGLALLPSSHAKWRGALTEAADAIALISVDSKGARGFGRPDGTIANYPVALILAARGDRAVNALPRVAAADAYARGSYHVRPGP